MKVFSITLKDVDFLMDEETGEFKQFYKNEEKFPCYITNYSLKLGKDLGLTETSLVSSLFALKGLDENDEAAYEKLDQTEMQKVIYIGFLGANKKTEISFEEFLDRFQYSYEETIELYMNLITSLMTSDTNKFAENLRKSTKTGKKI